MTKLTVDMADQPTVPSQLEDDSERACTADVWQRGAGVYRGRLTAWSGRLQRTFDSMERACTADVLQRGAGVWQRGAGVYTGRLTAWSWRVQRTFGSVERAFGSVERACTPDV